MPNTVPNQRIVNIHRERVTSDFLGIKNENWMAAARDLGAHALMLYLYLAANRDGYVLALSPAAIRDAIGMPRSTYHDQFAKLVSKGYLVQRNGNTYDFYEVACPRAADNAKEILSMPTSHGLPDKNGTFSAQIPPHSGLAVLTEDIEINNTDKRNKSINNDVYQDEWLQSSTEDEQEEEYPSIFLQPKTGEYDF